MWAACFVVLWPAVAWLDHAALTRLHEAAHGTLVLNRTANELLGIAIGTASLTPLSVYRYVHHQHHAHLGDEHDPEFVPYNRPGTSRWRRISYAWLELTVGWIFTPALYSTRTAKAWKSHRPRQRQRLLMEWAGLVIFWSVLLLVVADRGWWGYFAAAHVIPAWIAGTLQTIRKFTEHLGMTGDSILAMTRTVEYRHALGKIASRSQLHVDHHGTHHRWARIPFYDLPKVTPEAYSADPTARTFSSHFAALGDMLPHLLDPKVGPQWSK